MDLMRKCVLSLIFIGLVACSPNIGKFIESKTVIQYSQPTIGELQSELTYHTMKCKHGYDQSCSRMKSLKVQLQKRLQ